MIQYTCVFLFGGEIVEASDNKMAYRDKNKRIKTMKKTIIAICIILIIVPIILCILLFVKLNKLQNKLDSLISLEQSGEIVLTTNDLGEARFVYVEEVAQNDLDTTTESEIESNIVYLTFDDGPSKYTDDILNILDNYGVKATFFVVGKDDPDSLELYKDIVKKGNSLGLHTYSHKYESAYSSEEGFFQEISSLRTLLFNTTGEDVTLFRFPGGSSSPKLSNYGNNAEIFIDYLNNNGYTYFDWNVSSGDGASKIKTKEQIAANVLSGVEGKKCSVVLLHDDPNKGTSVEALPIIIESLLEKGYEIRSIDDTVAPVQHVTAETN